jgi:hypothetical protein
VGDSPERIQSWGEHLVWWCSQGFLRGNVMGILEQWEIRYGGESEPRNGKRGTPGDAIDPEGVSRVSDLIASVARTKAMEG